MNYIKQDTAFEQWCENNYLPILSYVIWRKLFKRFNRRRWEVEWVAVDNLTLMAESQIKSETTFITFRDELIKNGLIEYEKGKKMSPNKYKMVQLYADEKYTPLNGVNNEDSLELKTEFPCSQNLENAGVNVGNPSIIYNKHKGLNKNSYIAARLPRSKKFVPPTLDEVTAYCLERKNNIDAAKFIEHYSVADWHDSRGNPVKNWKQKMITVWENKNLPDTSDKRADQPVKSSGNPFAEYAKELEKEEINYVE